MSRRILLGAAMLWFAVGVSASPAVAGTVFFDDFESGLGQWTKKPVSYAGIVVDPMNAGNHVLSFSNRNTAGDIFSAPISVSPNSEMRLSLDYLGLTRPVGGGLVGFNDGTLSGLTPPTTWIAAFVGNGSYPEVFVDDGAWHSHSVTFNTGSFTQIRLVIEDWQGAPGYNAYFDNVTVSAVPEPGTMWLVLGVLAASTLARRRRRA